MANEPTLWHRRYSINSDHAHVRRVSPIVLCVHEIDLGIPRPQLFDDEFNELKISEIGIPHGIEPLIGKPFESLSIGNPRHSQTELEIFWFNVLSRCLPSKATVSSFALA